MKCFVIFLTSIAIIVAALASFSSNARLIMAKSQPAYPVASRPVRSLARQLHPRPYYAPAPVDVEPTPVYVEIGRQASRSGIVGGKPGCSREYASATDAQHPRHPSASPLNQIRGARPRTVASAAARPTRVGVGRRLTLTTESL
jgi:hypothetical protein